MNTLSIYYAMNSLAFLFLSKKGNIKRDELNHSINRIYVPQWKLDKSRHKFFPFINNQFKIYNLKVLNWNKVVNKPLNILYDINIVKAYENHIPEIQFIL